MTCGLRLLEVEDAVQGVLIPVYLLYPAKEPEQVHRFGPYSFQGALDAPVAGDGLPLVVLSHGNGGTPWGYRDLAKHLALAGFVVALVKHPGNSRNDNALARTAANLVNRPRHLVLTVDACFADMILGERLKPDCVGVIGHSIGAYTALAVAGGEPWAAEHESPEGVAHPIEVAHDERVRALVLLMPAAFWFPPGGLQRVCVPILMRSGEFDTSTPPAQAESILREVRDPGLVEYEEVRGAGHYSAMSVFPAPMNRPDFAPSQDPAGFDRVGYQATLFRDAEQFLKRTLCAG